MPTGVVFPDLALFVGCQPFLPRSLLVLAMVAVLVINGDQWEVVIRFRAFSALQRTPWLRGSEVQYKLVSHRVYARL